MEQRRLSIRMIEQMDFCEPYRFNDSIPLRPTMVHDDLHSTNTSTSDLSCQLAQSRGVAMTYNSNGSGNSRTNNRMTPPTTIYSQSSKYNSQQQQKEFVLPIFQSEYSKASINTSFSSSSTTASTTSIGSSSITFYRSPTKETYVVDELYNQNKDVCQDGTAIPMDQNSILNCTESKQVQRGVDRSITLPRETHLHTAPNTPIGVANKNICITENVLPPSTPILTTISPNNVNRNYVERTKSSIVSPTSLTVTPEITRPTKVFPRNTSASSILCMPPLYPTSPPQRPKLSTSASTQQNALWKSMRSSSSPVQRRILFSNAEAQQNVVANVPSSITMTPQSSKNSSKNCYDVNSGRRTVATMCLSPTNLTTTDTPADAQIPVAVETTTTNERTAPVMLELAPGVQIHLRGAEETQRAIHSGFYIQCECMFCSVSDTSTSNNAVDPGRNEMYCILDCDYFICPKCRSIHPNPISTNANVPTAASSNRGTRYPGGLGLGFRLENESRHL